MLQTELEFTLPRGYVDEQGNLHRQGTMRLATALDEVEPLQDARVRANEAYLGILLLSRVVTRLGDIGPVSPAVVERLFSADFAYLQDLYLRMNDVEPSVVETQCPGCGRQFALELAGALGDG
jgi:phage FluMu protein gp41